MGVPGSEAVPNPCQNLRGTTGDTGETSRPPTKRQHHSAAGQPRNRSQIALASQADGSGSVLTGRAPGFLWSTTPRQRG